jgi:hypothetical protein
LDFKGIYIHNTYTYTVYTQPYANNVSTIHTKKTGTNKTIVVPSVPSACLNPFEPCRPKNLLAALQPCLARPQRGDVSRWIQDGDCLRSWEHLGTALPAMKMMKMIELIELSRSEAF